MTVIRLRLRARVVSVWFFACPLRARNRKRQIAADKQCACRYIGGVFPFKEARMISLRISMTILAVVALVWLTWPRMVSADEDVTARARKFMEDYTARIRPLEIAANRAWWDANITGKPEDFKRKEEAQNKIDAVLSDKKAFAQLKILHRDAGIDEPIVRRAIDVIYLASLEKQLDPDFLKKMTALANTIEMKFNTFRAKVDGKEMKDAEVREVLKKSTLSDRRKVVWEASKTVGKVVERELLELVKLRNEAARKLGFKNFHAMQLFLNEQNGDDLVKLFDKLDDLTREPFQKAKAEIDAVLARNCNITVDELMPWHYHDPFFQETPAVFKADLDKIYASQDLVKLCRDFYRGIGLPIDLVIERSGDFSEHPGKSPHAFSTDITRDGTDVRVLANIVPNELWMTTMLHEFGHSVYTSINIPAKLPYVLRMESHILTTEGVAMMFERMSKKRGWLEKMGVTVPDRQAFDETAAKLSRYRLLVFSRWCQVMLRFEKSMYENPDQDLNKLWWDMVERYQLLRRPPGRSGPDYGSKIHIIVAPVYYHNYMMGEMFASQVHHAIARDVFSGADPNTVVYNNNPKVGEFMQRRVFDPGRTLKWNDLTRHATGADLSPDSFAQDFRSR
jgi:peptidyl-dipeptidase A